MEANDIAKAWDARGSTPAFEPGCCDGCYVGEGLCWSYGRSKVWGEPYEHTGELCEKMAWCFMVGDQEGTKPCSMKENETMQHEETSLECMRETACSFGWAVTGSCMSLWNGGGLSWVCCGIREQTAKGPHGKGLPIGSFWQLVCGAMSWACLGLSWSLHLAKIQDLNGPPK